MRFFFSFSKWAWAVITLGAVIGLVIIGIVEARTPAGLWDHPEWVAQNSPGAAFLPPKQPKSPTRIPIPDLDDCDVDKLANVPTEDGFIVVSQVLNGDTIQVDQSGTLVGLWGVDAPEAEQPGGQQAAEYLASLLPAGTLVTVWSPKPRRSGTTIQEDCLLLWEPKMTGRSTSRWSSADGLLSTRLRTNRLIHVYNHTLWGKMSTRLRTNRDSARLDRKGMWRRYDNGGERPWRWRQRHN